MGERSSSLLTVEEGGDCGRIPLRRIEGERLGCAGPIPGVMGGRCEPWDIDNEGGGGAIR